MLTSFFISTSLVKSIDSLSVISIYTTISSSDTTDWVASETVSAASE